MSRRSRLFGLALSGFLVAPASVAFIGPATATTPTDSTVTTGVLATANKTKYTNVNAVVRKGPGTNYAKIKTLGVGTKVTVTQTKNGWSKISNPTTGWIKSSLLSSTLGNTYYSYSEAIGKRMDTGCFLAGTEFKTVERLNFRALPTTDSSVLFTMDKGDRLTLNVDMCFAKDSWLSVDWIADDYYNGWVFTHYLVAVG